MSILLSLNFSCWWMKDVCGKPPPPVDRPVPDVVSGSFGAAIDMGVSAAVNGEGLRLGKSSPGKVFHMEPGPADDTVVPDGGVGQDDDSAATDTSMPTEGDCMQDCGLFISINLR